MHIYVNLIILGLIGVALSAYLSFQELNQNVAFISSLLSFTAFLLITYFLTKKEMEIQFNEILQKVRKKYNLKIHKLKKEHDTTTLERTIRNGTQTLIKNAVDYFKIDNIKNEMGASAAIQNLQLDKYGQIIELLADFSLILPDYEENQRIVQQEIDHQIEIYSFDEKAFAEFLRRIMEKYRVTFNKKLKEKEALNGYRPMKVCPRCAEKAWPNAQLCRYCGHVFESVPSRLEDAENGEVDWNKRGYYFYRSGKYDEAIISFTRAIDLDPSADQAYFNRGILHLKQDNQTMAMDDLRAAAGLGHEKARRVLTAIEMMQTQDGSRQSPFSP